MGLVVRSAEPPVTSWSWDGYYAATPRRAPSLFAREVDEKWLRRRVRIIDIGAGDGADSFWFAARDHDVVALDKSLAAVERMRGVRPLIKPVCGSAEIVLRESAARFDVAYMRWFLHAVGADVEASVFDWCAARVGMVCIEARSDHGTHPSDHFRRPLNLEATLRALEARGFAIAHAAEGYGFSVVAGDDPMLLRVIAVKDTD